MSLTPLTLNMTVPRTQDGTQLQHQENMRSTTEHLMANEKMEKEVRQTEQTVIKKQDADFAEYQYDAKNKGNNEYQDNRKKKEQKQNEEETSDKSETKDSKDKPKRVVSIDITL